MIKSQLLAVALLGAGAVSSSKIGCPTANLLENPSFETGVFSPWNNMSTEQELVSGDANDGNNFA